MSSSCATAARSTPLAARAFGARRPSAPRAARVVTMALSQDELKKQARRGRQQQRAG